MGVDAYACIAWPFEKAALGCSCHVCARTSLILACICTLESLCVDVQVYVCLSTQIRVLAVSPLWKSCDKLFLTKMVGNVPLEDYVSDWKSWKQRLLLWIFVSSHKLRLDQIRDEAAMAFWTLMSDAGGICISAYVRGINSVALLVGCQNKEAGGTYLSTLASLQVGCVPPHIPDFVYEIYSWA
jgi:hypothetical protein